jgi:hypothetical protein
MADRLDFEIDIELETGLITGHAGVPGLIEAFRQTGTAAVIGREVKVKSRKRGLSASEMGKSLLAMWAEQDVIVADEFRDGNVPAGSGNRRVVEKAIAASTTCSPPISASAYPRIPYRQVQTAALSAPQHYRKSRPPCP